MNEPVAIVAALQREVAPLVRGVQADTKLRSRGVYLYRLPRAVVVTAGMGAARAALAVEAALAMTPHATLISTGLAGACSAQASVGSVIEAGVVVDTRTGESFETCVPGGAVLVSTAEIASVAEKARLAASYGALLVDMEAATIARLAAAHGVPFRAIKAVSDAHDFELQALGQFAGMHGSFRTAAFAAHIALRPWMWSRTITLGKNSATALRSLTETLQAIIEQT